MLRMLSSALGDRLEKFSYASKRIAEGDVEPGRKTDTDEAAPSPHKYASTTAFARTHLVLSAGSRRCRALLYGCRLAL